MIKIFNHYIHRRTLLQIMLDFGLIIGTVLLSVGWHTEDLSLAASAALPSAALMGLGALAINAALGFYQRVHNRSVAQSRARAVLSLFLILPLAFFLLHVVPVGMVNRDYVALAIVAGTVLMLVHRVYVGHSSAQSMLRQRILVFGTGTRAKLVGRTLQRSDPHVDLVGYYASPNEAVAEVSAWGILSPNTSLTDIVMEQQVDEIVVALAERRGGSMPLRELLDCKLQGVRVVDMATHFEKTLGQIRLDSVSAGWLIFGDGFSQGLLRTIIKRLFDIVCAVILLIVASPIIVLTGILIVLESGGPILYLQERVGLNGRLFNVVKFRSMRTDAEQDGQPRWASAQDDRVTRVGRIIRKLRIDELPQLFSVLNGDMSLVGPRPERPYFVDKLTQEIPYFAVRQSVKPGVTGWAQVRYHYGASVEDSAEKLQYDLYYVKNHTLFLDLVILFETVSVVLTAKGAH
ncbi:MAG: TIGR03013 family XrtA/PEP-CTERM system glycosyltransferase [Burkholderiaceae bacterium]